MSDNEMLKLADEIEYAIQTEDYVTLFSGGASLVVSALRAAAASAEPVEIDPTNHHNALLCPYCNPKGLKFAAPDAEIVAALELAWRALGDARASIVTGCDTVSAIASIDAASAALAKAKGGSVLAIANLREAALRLEQACDQLAAERSDAVYSAMIAEGQANLLLELDHARRSVREALGVFGHE